jgi:biotin transport system substrate-specific component
MMRQTAVQETGHTSQDGSIADRTVATPSIANRSHRAGRARYLALQGGIAIAATALVALCAHISIPLGFTPVPITLQPFAVLLLGLLLAPEVSFAALSLYLLEGAAGLPVFSPHGPGGIAQLLGPTGGYLIAAPFAAAVAGLVYRDGKRRLLSAVAGAALGDLILLSIGTLWLGALAHTSFSALLHQAVVPFLASDAVKVAAAAGCAHIFASFSGAPSAKHSSQAE